MSFINSSPEFTTFIHFNDNFVLSSFVLVSLKLGRRRKCKITPF